MTDPTVVPGPEGQDIDEDAALPDPRSVGESFDHPSATHGDFHRRPGFRGHDEVLPSEQDGG